MAHFVGLDASKQTTHICVIDEAGSVVKEGSVPTEHAAIIGFLRGEGRRYRRIGLESMGFASWLFEGIAKAGLPIICIEARHAHGVLKAKLNKTDRNDARGIAEIMRVGIYKAVHVKTPGSREAKLILMARRLLKRKQRDIDNVIRGALLQAGCKLTTFPAATFGRRAVALSAVNSVLEQVVKALAETRDVLIAQIGALERKIGELVLCDPVCRRFLTVPGVGPITSLTYRSAVDVPEKFAKSRNVGVHLGLTPRVYQSGAMERHGRISKCGDEAARSSLFLAAQSILRANGKASTLKTWARALLQRKKYHVAAVAVARRLAVILHRMWLNGSDFSVTGGSPPSFVAALTPL